MAQFKRVINIPTGAATTILATKPCRGYTVKESILLANGTSANTPQGINVVDQTSPNQPTIQLPPPSTTNEPGEFPTFKVGVDEDASFHGPHGQILANGPNYVIGQGATAALPLCTVASNTGSNTAVEVTEYV
jgi:hypothetical protein